MGRSTRMFEIIQILRNAANPRTAQQIAEELEVTKRTVYRDIAALQAMRVPVEGEAGVPRELEIITSILHRRSQRAVLHTNSRPSEPPKIWHQPFCGCMSGI